MTGETMHSKRRLSAKKRQRRALDLKIAGATYQQIADELGYRTASGAHKAVSSALTAMLRPPADELRALESERLDNLWRRLWVRLNSTTATTDAVKIADRLIRLSQRRAALLGLDSPIKADLTITDWRTAAQDAGLNPSELFNELVGILARQMSEANHEQK